ncbi:META domain-containing protein [Moraxella sp. PS-22]|uniref:META domain-containing protein n=1 Tax=Moraxella tetraodonis TaxID=2767221 RepID=A0A9X2A4L7_9GAMM|nr:META domain-containing protein [Moraxella tetraodonis]MCG8147738.1 META domain-containing protein [Moraxella tetraodonis]
MINNQVKGSFKTSALLMLALTGCQTVNTNPSAPSERVPYVQLPIFIGSTPTTNSLQSYDWQLNNINSTDPITWNGSYLQTQNGKVTLNFNQNHITYNVGCNQLSNQYSLSKNTMQPIGTGISTLMGCGELQAREQWLAKQMQSPSELQIMETQVDAVLSQTTADGSWLQWVGKLKPEVKYGKGETVFLEVKPKWQYCDNVTDKKCLEVRDINYDNQGLKTAVGQWYLLDAPIMGYRHDESAQRVLRLTRYRTPPTDTKGYGSLYKLDSVIETKTMAK